MQHLLLGENDIILMLKNNSVCSSLMRKDGATLYEQRSVNTQEVADILKIARNTVYELIKEES